MRIVNRRQVDSLLDRLRFAVDTAPAMDYQPLPWLGIHEAKRRDAVVTRWRAIRPLVTELDIHTAADVGCNVGFYAINLSRMGVATLGVEASAKHFRIYRYALERLGVDNAGALWLKLGPSTVDLLPTVDCVVFLSVWHHVSREFGFQAAQEVLRGLWARTRKVLFFETGQNEMPAYYNLPDMGPDPTSFLAEHLGAACSGARVVDLGRHDALFGPRQDRHTDRTLFGAIRE
jgi:hypothetical protein